MNIATVSSELQKLIHALDTGLDDENRDRQILAERALHGLTALRAELLQAVAEGNLLAVEVPATARAAHWILSPEDLDVMPDAMQDMISGARWLNVYVGTKLVAQCVPASGERAKW